MTTSAPAATPLAEQVVERLADTPDPRLHELMSALVRHLHAFAQEVRLTEQEWALAIAFLTETGRACTGTRQEFILLSDVLGLSMLVDALAHDAAQGATETTVLGPFYVPDSPQRENGASTAERPSGEPALISGRVLDTDGAPIARAEVDVWQNGADGLYAAQDPSAPAGNLRGRFLTDDQGRYSFVGVRPVDYQIPTDGPVGRLLEATGRHAWRPAHLHLIARAPGYRTLTTHVFDEESAYLSSDAVFGVKDSLVAHFHPHDPDDPARPETAGPGRRWYSLDQDLVLARDPS